MFCTTRGCGIGVGATHSFLLLLTALSLVRWCNFCLRGGGYSMENIQRRIRHSFRIVVDAKKNLWGFHAFLRPQRRRSDVSLRGGAMERAKLQYCIHNVASYAVTHLFRICSAEIYPCPMQTKGYQCLSIQCIEVNSSACRQHISKP